MPVPAEHVGPMMAALLMQRIRPIGLRRPSRVVGWLLLLAGLGGIFQSMRERGPGDIQHSDVLVTSGLHSLTRNPMYVAWNLVHAGLALFRGGWLLVTWPVSAALIHRAILREEEELADRFPQEFAAYRRRVPRYL